MSYNTGDEYVSGSPKKLGNVDFERVPTNQEGVALPVVQGTALLGVTWIDGARNVNAYEIKVKVGKDKETVGHNYYADVAGLVCMGPVDRLLAVYAEEDVVWEGDLSDPGAGYVDIQTDIGNARFHFGGADQTIDGYVLDPDDHPGYQNQALIEFKQQFFGRDNTNARQIEVLVVRAVPDADMIDDLSINPGAALREVITNSIWGAGQNNFPLANAQAVIDQIDEDGLGMSFNWNKITDADKVIEKILASFNGSIVWEGGQYVLKQGYRPPEDTDELPVIMAKDCASLPKTTITAYADCPGEIRMNYTNRDSNFNDATALKRSQTHRLLNGIRQTSTIERLEVDNTATALKLLAQAVVQMSLPTTEGSFEIRAVDGEPLKIAEWFWLELWPGAELTLCRCTNKKNSDALSRDLTIEYEADATRWAYTGVAGGDVYIPPAPPQYFPETHLFQQLIETPRFMTSGIDLIVAAGRAHSLTIGFSPYFALGSDPTYSAAKLVSNSSAKYFGLPVEVKTATGTSADLVLTPLNDDVGEYESVAAAAQQAGELLLFLEDEIISLRDYFINGDDLELDDCLRGFGDTKPEDHAVGTKGIILYASEAFRINPAPGETTNRNIKIPAETLQDVQDLADVSPLPWVSNLRINRPLNVSAVTIAGESLPLPSHHMNLADYELNTTFDWGNTPRITVAKRSWADLGFVSADFYDPSELETVVRVYEQDGETLHITLTDADDSFTLWLSSDGNAKMYLEITTRHPAAPELESLNPIWVTLNMNVDDYAVDGSGEFARDNENYYCTE